MNSLATATGYSANIVLGRRESSSAESFMRVAPLCYNMKPSLDTARYSKALDALAQETGADSQLLHEALTNEARLHRREEAESELRLGDVI